MVPVDPAQRRSSGTYCTAFFACIIPCNPYHHPEAPPLTHAESEAQSGAVTISRVAQPGSDRAGMKASVALHPQPQLLSRPGRGRFASQFQAGLRGFQHLHSAATALWPAGGRAREEFAAPLPACLGCLPLQPGLSQHLCCLQIIHARVIHARREASHL